MQIVGNPSCRFPWGMHLWRRSKLWRPLTECVGMDSSLLRTTLTRSTGGRIVRVGCLVRTRTRIGKTLSLPVSSAVVIDGVDTWDLKGVGPDTPVFSNKIVCRGLFTTVRMPKRTDRHACVRENVLLSDGVVGCVMLDERYRPYDVQPIRIENLCGSFTERVESSVLKGVVMNTVSPFGRQREVYTLHGNVTINQGRGSFMGAQSVAGLERLASMLDLSTSENVVHMAVICGKIGKRLQVSSSGLLETKLNKFASNVRIEGRMYDHTNTVRLHVFKFEDDGLFELARAFRPDKNDWTVTGRGTVMIRFTWKRVRWTAESEAACMRLCSRVVETCLSA